MCGYYRQYLAVLYVSVFRNGACAVKALFMCQCSSPWEFPLPLCAAVCSLPTLFTMGGKKNQILLIKQKMVK